jgi:hypothetical protein
MKLKIVCGSDMRLFRYPTTDRYSALLLFIAARFSLAESDYSLYYSDDEGDNITISTDDDLEEAFGIAMSEERKSLKIFIIKKAHVAAVAPVAEKVCPTKGCVADDSKADVEIAAEAESNSNSNSNQEENKPKKDFSTTICDFLRDEKVTQVLPEFVQRTIAALKAELWKPVSGEDVAADSENKKDLDVIAVVKQVLNDKIFLPITSHESFPWIEASVFPQMADRAVKYLPYLATVAEEQIAAWMAVIIPALQTFDITNLFVDQSGDGGCSVSQGPCFPGIAQMHGMAGFNPFQLFGMMSNPQPATDKNATGNETGTAADEPQERSQNQGFFRNWHHGHHHGRGRRGRHGWHGRHGHRGHHGRRQRFTDIQSNIATGFPGFATNETNAHLMAKVSKSVTLRDGTYYPLDTILSKVWKIKNVGTFDWGANGSAVHLVFEKGDESMLIERRFPVTNLCAGQECNVTAMIKTPTKPGRYQVFFRLQRSGDFFGPQLWVDIYAVDENGMESLEQAIDNSKRSYRQRMMAKKVLDNQFLNENEKMQMKLAKKEAKLENRQMKLQTKNVQLENKLASTLMNGIAKNDQKADKKCLQKSRKLNKKMSKLQEKMQSLELQREALASQMQNLHNVNSNSNSNSNNVVVEEVVLDEEFEMVLDNGSSDEEGEDDVPVLEAQAEAVIEIEEDVAIAIAMQAEEEAVASIAMEAEVEIEIEHEFRYSAQLAQIETMGLDADIGKALLLEYRGQVARVVEQMLG